jgi:RNA polymerase sigma-70 factor (ECF subfamily)
MTLARSTPPPALTSAVPMATTPTTRPGPGEAAALTALMPALARRCRRLTRDPAAAEDLAQEALARVWAQIRAGAAIDDLAPYLMTAARNLARRPGPAMQPLDGVAEAAVAPEGPRRVMLREVAGQLAALAPADRRILLCQALDGASYAEIAAAEGLAIGTVMSRLARARARLRAGCGLPAHGPAALGLLDGDAA